MKDSLTNIASLKALQESLSNISHPKLILIDLKDFQALNLHFSDVAGDFVLCEFAKELEKFANTNEMQAFRVEEDEFALLKDMPFDLSSIEKLLYSVADFIKAQQYTYQANEINIDAHLGLCLDQNNLLEKAHKALKVAQNEDQPFVTYSEFVNTLLDEGDEKICNLLKHAVATQTVIPFFQKVVDRNAEKIYTEIFMRIQTKDSIEPPKLFLDIAKKRGLYTQIIENLIEQIKNIQEQKAVNISCEDLYDDNLLKTYLESFQNSNTIFELQNDASLHDDKAKEKIEILKNNGIKICLDNIEHADDIKKWPIDFVKVSGELTRHLHRDTNAFSICQEIIATCKELHIKTIASHINSEGTFEKAKKLGFDAFQGYFLEKPTSTFAE